MRNLILASALALSLGASPTFEVKELTPQQVALIDTAETTVNEAKRILLEAQKNVEHALKVRNDIQLQVAGETYEGTCGGWAQESGGAWKGSERHFRRVEFRGRYALITEGAEACTAILGTSGVFTYNDSVGHFAVGKK